jgi:hypothetical protein
MTLAAASWKRVSSSTTAVALRAMGIDELQGDCVKGDNAAIIPLWGHRSPRCERVRKSTDTGKANKHEN